MIAERMLAERTPATSALRQRKTQPEYQFLAFIEKPLIDLNLRKQSSGIRLFRTLVLPISVRPSLLS
jgi:hypothetical protein